MLWMRQNGAEEAKICKFELWRSQQTKLCLVDNLYHLFSARIWEGRYAHLGPKVSGRTPTSVSYWFLHNSTINNGRLTNTALDTRSAGAGSKFILAFASQNYEFRLEFSQFVHESV